MKKQRINDVRLVDIEILLRNDWTVTGVRDSEIHGRTVVLSYPSEGLHCEFPPDGRPTFYLNRMDGGIDELPPPVALMRAGVMLNELPKPH